MLDPAEVRSLVASAAQGDQRAWNRLVDAYAGLVWSVARGFGLYGADAADVSQTVWLRLVEHLGRLREPERLAGWLATTTRHECLRTLRRSGRSVSMAEPPELDPDGAPSLDEALLVAEDRDRLLAGLEQLRPLCQVLLRMMLADPPLSYDDISDALDIPRGSIGPTRGRCLEHLRRVLEPS